MESTHSEIEYLRKEIDSFIQKFYLNQLIKGLLLFLGVFSFSYLLLANLAYFADLSSWVRFVFLLLFVGMNAFLLISWILIPLLRKLGFLKRMDHFEAAALIGFLFPDIADRLTNTLQLIEQQKAHDTNLDLLAASIAQKTAQLNLFSFSTAIDLSGNKRYAKYILPSFFTLLILLIFIPAILTQGTYKIIRYDKVFLPFEFELQEGKGRFEEGSDVPISVSLKGDRIPDRVYLVTDQGKYLMNRSLKNRHDFVIKKVKTSGSFYFEANGYESSKFPYTVTGKSLLGKVQLQINYPGYLNKKDELIENAGDIQVPEGSKLTWMGSGKNTAWLKLKHGNKTQQFNGTAFTFHSKAINSGNLKILLSNVYSNKIDSASLQVAVIKDAFPSIQVSESSDSIKEGIRYFNGLIADDYGLSNLSFHYTLIRKGKALKTKQLPVSFQNGTKSNFDFAVDFRLEDVQLEDKIEYYFLVKDNDGVNGSKSSKSYVGQYQLPDLEQLNEQRSEQQAQTKKELERLLTKTKDFERSVDKLKNDLSNSKSNDWNNKQQLKQLQEEQKSLANDLQQMKEQLEQTTQEKNQLSEIDKALLEKQEMIEKLLDEVMDEELMKLLEELEKLFNERADQEIQKEMNKLDQQAENMNKQLDRTLEMLKKLQVNEKIDDIEKELKENAAKQEELKKDIEADKINKEEAEKRQEEINKRFDEIQKKLEETKALNKELESPLNLEDSKALEDAIEIGRAHV